MAEETLFVDDLVDNVRAARQVGLGAIVVARGSVSPGEGERVVRDLHELADLILRPESPEEILT